MANELQKELVSKELQMEIQKVITNFESKEEPTIKLTYHEKTKVLAQMVAKRI